MLELRPSCECCDAPLPGDSLEARICSFECTFCVRCAEEKVANICPNCGGLLMPRPPRALVKWAKYPPSDVRVVKPGRC
jgi:uncharacterized protein